MRISRSMYAVVCTVLIFLCNSMWTASSERIHDGSIVQSTIPNTSPQENSSPRIEIIVPSDGDEFTWGTPVRYEITVSDDEDGESRYEEINPMRVSLEIYYQQGEEVQRIEPHGTKSLSGLTWMRNSTCFGCHADKTALVGPSFSQIADRYSQYPDTVRALATHILEGSTGRWGSEVMPPHPDISPDEAHEIIQYILEQGSKNDSWVYPGLQGLFRIIPKPENTETGVFVLKASYTDHGIDTIPGSELTGTDTVILSIK